MLIAQSTTIALQGPEPKKLTKTIVLQKGICPSSDWFVFEKSSDKETNLLYDVKGLSPARAAEGWSLVSGLEEAKAPEPMSDEEVAAELGVPLSDLEPDAA